MIIDVHTHPYDESVTRLPLRVRAELPTHTTGPSEDLWEGWLAAMGRLLFSKEQRAVVMGCSAARLLEMD